MTINLELTADEFVAVLALIGVGMNTYLNRPSHRHQVALDALPKSVIDSLVGKFNAHAGELLEGLPQ
jgi:hypothetical protein